jgi:hypothetical protein
MSFTFTWEVSDDITGVELHGLIKNEPNTKGSKYLNFRTLEKLLIAAN